MGCFTDSGVRRCDLNDRGAWSSPAYELGKHTDSVSILRVSADGKKLLTTGLQGRISCWDLSQEASNREAAIVLHTDAVAPQAAADPTGRWLAVSGSPPRLWDLEAESARAWELATPSAANLRVHAAVNAEGNWVAIGGRDGRVDLWDTRGVVQHGPKRHTLAERPSKVTSVVMSPNGRWLIASWQDFVTKLWDLKAEAPFATVVDLISEHSPRLWLSKVAISRQMGRSYRRHRWLVDTLGFDVRQHPRLATGPAPPPRTCLRRCVWPRRALVGQRRLRRSRTLGLG